jgi:hypothetical protein
MVITTCMETTMKNVPARKRNNQKKLPKIAGCPFCGSERVHIFGTTDDRGLATFVRCIACETEGPFIRGLWVDDNAVTDEIRREAILPWNRVAAAVRQQQSKAQPRPRPAAKKSPDHHVHVIAPSKATNGQNGHHSNGSVA